MALEGLKTRLILLLALFSLTSIPAYGDGLYGGAPWPFSCSSVEPTVYVGYLSQSNVPTLTLDTDAGNGMRLFNLKIHTEGIWTEFSLPVKGGGRFGFVVAGGYLFSFPTESETTYRLSTTQAARTWRTSTQGYNLRCALTYDIRPWFSLIAGVRLDNFLAATKDPKWTVGTIGTALDTATLDFNAYLPFVGAMLRGSPGGLRTNLGIIACPGMWGAVRYIEGFGGGIRIAGTSFPVIFASNQFGGGYFFETFADCSLPVGYFNLGGFFKLNIFSGSGSAGLAENLGYASILPPTLFPKVDCRLNFDVRNWTVGGQVGVPF
jgi:hypothetical protein